MCTYIETANVHNRNNKVVIIPDFLINRDPILQIKYVSKMNLNV